MSSTSRPRLGTTLALAAGGLLLAAAVIRLSVRDSLPATALVYYATPWPVQAALLVLVGGGLRLRNRSGWSAPVASTGLVMLVAWTISAHSTPENVGLRANTISCLTWNTDHGQAGWNRLAETIRGEETDLVCLVEAGGLGSGMLVLVKNGTVRQTRSGSLDGNARYRQFDVNCRGQSLVLVVVDVKSTPWISRQESLRQIADLVTAIPDRPVLVTGDFNTPTDSAWFDAWRPGLKNAWEQAGDGFRPTWPVPLPLLDLDQCWGNAHVVFVHCRAASSSRSDHRLLLTRFAIKPP